MLEAANTQLELLTVRELNSNAGGMDAGGAPEVGSWFCTYASAHTTAKICYQMLRLGALTFVLVAQGAIGNVHQTKTADVARLLDPATPAWQLLNLELYELSLRSEAGLIVRDDRVQRGLLAGTLAKVRFVPKVDHVLTLSVQNEKNAQRYCRILHYPRCVTCPRYPWPPS